MQESQIKSGDCVELKHGADGVEMTVDFIFDYQGRERASCKWFNKEQHKFEELAVDVTALKLCGS